MVVEQHSGQAWRAEETEWSKKINFSFLLVKKVYDLIGCWCYRSSFTGIFLPEVKKKKSTSSRCLSGTVIFYYRPTGSSVHLTSNSSLPSHLISSSVFLILCPDLALISPCSSAAIVLPPSRVSYLAWKPLITGLATFSFLPFQFIFTRAARVISLL